MKHHVTSWSKQVLAWVLTLAMVAGMFTSYLQTVAQTDSTKPVLLAGKEATTKMEVLYEEDFNNYENALLGDNFYIPSNVTANVETNRLYVESAESVEPLYILEY